MVWLLLFSGVIQISYLRDEVSTDQWRLAIDLFHNYSIITSCVGIRIDLVFIINWFYNITRLLKHAVYVLKSFYTLIFVITFSQLYYSYFC